MRTIAIDSQVLNDVMACGYKAYLRFIRNKSPEHKAEALGEGRPHAQDACLSLQANQGW